MVRTATGCKATCDESESHSAFSQTGSRFMHSNNWDDLRFVLAVAESGSVSAAARVLGVNCSGFRGRLLRVQTSTGEVIFTRFDSLFHFVLVYFFRHSTYPMNHHESEHI